jgi:putative colanic acid biosynthesis acetyltransferase WcaF
VRRNVRIHFPWNLEIGDFCWIGDSVEFINHAKVKIGNNVCISQGSVLCSSSHDFMSLDLSYKHKKIDIQDGVWIALGVLILPGVEIGEGSVVSAGEILRSSLPNQVLFKNGKTEKIKYE